MARSELEADANYSRHGGDLTGVPAGPYCYRMAGVVADTAGGPPSINIEACPYWGYREIEGETFGYCAHLKTGDWVEDGTSFLFDMVKSCGLNDEEVDDRQREQ